MNPYAMILDETVHTVPHVLVRYPLVFATGKCSVFPTFIILLSRGCLLARRAVALFPYKESNIMLTCERFFSNPIFLFIAHRSPCNADFSPITGPPLLSPLGLGDDFLSSMCHGL